MLDSNSCVKLVVVKLKGYLDNEAVVIGLSLRGTTLEEGCAMFSDFVDLKSISTISLKFSSPPLDSISSNVLDSISCAKLVVTLAPQVVEVEALVDSLRRKALQMQTM